MRIGTLILVCTAMAGFLCASLSVPLFAQDVGGAAKEVGEKVKEVGEKTKDVYEKGKEGVKSAVKDGTKAVTEGDFWDKVPPYIALPASLVAGLLLGVLVGRSGKGDKKKKDKKK